MISVFNRIRFNSLLTLSSAVVLLSSALVGGGTLAAFSDTAASTGNTFVSGTLDVTLSDVNETSASAISASVSGSNIAPGDVVSGLIDVNNAGSLDFQFQMSTIDSSVAGAANAAMASALTVEVESQATTDACTGPGAGTDVVSAGTALSGASLGPRTLTTGSSERLCFYVTLPSGTGNTAQGGTASFDLSFSAQQL